MSDHGHHGLRPVLDDPETGGFFAAAREHRLVVQSCAACAHTQHPPRPRCTSCRSADLGWVDVAQAGTVHSWTVVEHQISPAFPAPYTVVLVDVDVPGATAPVRFLGHLPGRHRPAVGDPARLVFDDVDDELTLPNWTLDG